MTTKLEAIGQRVAGNRLTLDDCGLLLDVAEAAAKLGPDVFDDIRTLLGDVLRLTAEHPIMLALDALEAGIAPLLEEET